LIKIYKIVVVILLFANTGLSQGEHFFSFDAGLSQNHKGFYTLYSGIINIGGGYYIRIIRHFYGGLSIHLDYFKRTNTTAGLIIYQPKINFNYDIPVNRRIDLVTILAGGYSFLRNSNKEYNYRETQAGFNSLAEIQILWKTRDKFDFYLFGRYDYIYLDRNEDFTRLEYYRKVNLTCFGLGVRIKNN
jgi:hypothetical protein